MDKEIKIAVAGTGYVGLSIATLLAQHHQVTAVDVIPEKVNLINITLAKDITLTEVWTPIGNYSNQYTGAFDGNDHAISGLTIDQSGTQYAGLIGYIGSGGAVKNLKLTNVNVSGYMSVGAVVGWSDGTISGCSVSGNIKGNQSVGGVAGNEGLGGVDAGLGEDLLGAELVAGASDGDGAGGGPEALHLELADDSTAVAGHVVGDARDDGVEAGEVFPVVENTGVLLVEREVAVLVFDDADGVATLLGLGDEAFGGVVGVAVGENSDVHGVIVPFYVCYVNAYEYIDGGIFEGWLRVRG